MKPDKFLEGTRVWAQSVPRLNIINTSKPPGDPKRMPVVFAIGSTTRNERRVWIALNSDLRAEANRPDLLSFPAVGMNLDAWLAAFAQCAVADPQVRVEKTLEIEESVFGGNPAVLGVNHEETIMSVTKRDFEALAAEIRKVEPMEVRVMAMRPVIAWAVRANPQFDGEKFARACGIDAERT